MKLWSVRRKTDGREVYQYQHDQPLDLQGFELTFHDHIDITPAPEQPPVYEGSWKLTRMAFRRRFTEDEKTDIEYAALDIPTASVLNRKRAAALRVYLQDVIAAEYVDLKDPYVRGGLTKIEQLGLLAPGRAAIIGDTVPQPSELAP